MPQTLGRRLRAARELAGLRSAEALADAINEPGLGPQTLRAFEKGRKTPTPRDLGAIAAACGVSVGFLTGPEDAVRRPDGDHPDVDATLERIDERLERIEAALLSADLQAVRDFVSAWAAGRGEGEGGGESPAPDPAPPVDLRRGER